MQTQELVTIVPWTFIAQICNLFIQVYLMKRFLFKPVAGILEKRKAQADAQLADARKEREDAVRMKEEYEQNVASAKAEAKEIIRAAKHTATVRKEAILAEANMQAAGLRARAEADIILEQKKAVNDMKKELGSIAMDLACKVIEREIKEDDHRKLIEGFIENVGEAS